MQWPPKTSKLSPPDSTEQLVASWPWSQEARAAIGETGPRVVLEILPKVEVEEEEEDSNMMEGIIW